MKRLIALLAALLPAAPAFAQSQPVTENAARSYVASAFITGAAPAILSDAVQVGPALRERLALPAHPGRDTIYRALVALTEGRAVHVTQGPRDLAGFDRAALVVEAGEDVRLVVQYDLRANNISFVGLPRSATAGASSAPPGANRVKVALVARPPARATRLTLRPVLFEFDRATLSEGAQAILGGEIAEKLHRATAIRVTGYADPIGAPAYNLRLSQQRAEAVRERLVALGIDVSRIDVAAGGSISSPLRCSDAGRRSARIACLAPQRRVELVVELAP